MAWASPGANLSVREDEMRKPILAFLLLTVCLATVTLGQGTTSRVTGTVVDEKGSVVPGAVVTLTNEATQSTLTTETASGGTYVFDSIQVGKYTVSVEKQGFKKSDSSSTCLPPYRPNRFQGHDLDIPRIGWG